MKINKPVGLIFLHNNAHHEIILHCLSILSCSTLTSLFTDTFHAVLSFAVHTSILLTFLEHNLPFTQHSKRHTKRIWLLSTVPHNSTWIRLCGMYIHNGTLATHSDINTAWPYGIVTENTWHRGQRWTHGTENTGKCGRYYIFSGNYIWFKNKCTMHIRCKKRWRCNPRP
jgi:hypothetical protein